MQTNAAETTTGMKRARAEEAGAGSSSKMPKVEGECDGPFSKQESLMKDWTTFYADHLPNWINNVMDACDYDDTPDAFRTFLDVVEEGLDNPNESGGLTFVCETCLNPTDVMGRLLTGAYDEAVKAAKEGEEGDSEEDELVTFTVSSEDIEWTAQWDAEDERFQVQMQDNKCDDYREFNVYPQHNGKPGLLAHRFYLGLTKEERLECERLEKVFDEQNGTAVAGED